MAGAPAVLRFTRGLPQTKQFGERLRLLVTQGNDKGACFVLLGEDIFIGREDCQITINDPNASKKHAEVHWKGDHYSVKDLGSSNGIVLNGAKVPEGKLQAGDVLLIGLTIFEVYAPGAVRKMEGTKLPALAPKKTKPNITPSSEALAAGGGKPEEKKKMEKKRLVVFGLLFFLFYIAFFMESEEKPQTFRERAKIEAPEGEAQPKKKLKKNEIEQALKDYVPSYVLDTPQRKNAQVFFQNGMREYQNRNFRRAISAFETATTVDSKHELAKVYLARAKKDLESEIVTSEKAAIQAYKSLRYKEARMHYENILRLLEGDTTNKSYQTAQEALKKLDEESKIR